MILIIRQYINSFTEYPDKDTFNLIKKELSKYFSDITFGEINVEADGYSMKFNTNHDVYDILNLITKYDKFTIEIKVSYRDSKIETLN